MSANPRTDGKRLCGDPEQVVSKARAEHAVQNCPQWRTRAPQLFRAFGLPQAADWKRLPGLSRDLGASIYYY